MKVYTNNFKNSVRELTQLINNCSKVAGYKINSKSVAHLYTNDVRSEKDIREIIHFTKVISNIKSLRVTLTK